MSAAAAADTLWWIAGGVDDVWNTTGNWVLGSNHDPQLPDGIVPAYITTSNHVGLEVLPAALVDASVSGVDHALSGPLYIGGWSNDFDSEHGNPHGHSGVLDVTGGELHVNGYLRVGMRGAEGIIHQSGGRLSSDLAMTLGWLSPDSLGTFHLSGGTLATREVHVGVQGSGVFTMTGGVVEKVCEGCRALVGSGFTTSTQVYIAGEGLLDQSGGNFESDRLVVGRFVYSVGTVLVSGDAWMSIPVMLEVGVEGDGEISQTGGSVQVGRTLELGKEPGSYGAYTFAGGTFHQLESGSWSGVPSGVYVGLAGDAELRIIGAGADIQIAGVYAQAANAVWTVVLDASANHVSPIEVAGAASFADGATLRVELSQGFSPMRGDSFVLLTAAEGVDDQGLRLAKVNEAEWSIDSATNDSVTLTYKGRDRIVSFQAFGSPDVEMFDGVEVRPIDAINVDSGALMFDAFPDAIPEDLDAFHRLSNGDVIFSTSTDVTQGFGGLASFRNGDLILWDGVQASLLFSEAVGFGGEDHNIDAFSILPNGHWILSTALAATLGGLSFQNGDIVEYDPVADVATLYMGLDEAAIFTGASQSNADIDALHVLENGNVVFSIRSDGVGRIGNALIYGFSDQPSSDLFVLDPASGDALLYLEGDGLFDGVTRNLDVVYLPEPGFALLVATGVAALVALSGFRSRRRRTVRPIIRG